jgi:Na+/glutamate symporter
MQNQKITQTKIETNPNEQKLKETSIGFKVHLGVTVAVSSLLVTINMLTLPQFPWCVFPTVAMSIGVIMHYFGMRSFRKKVKNEN